MKTYSIAALFGAALTTIAACPAGKANDPVGGNGGDSYSTVATAATGASGGGGAAAAPASAPAASTGTGANPGSCIITCNNNAPNHEVGCDGCLAAACSSQYALCAADKGDAGCVSCSELLTQGGNGADCDESATLMKQLLDCACSANVCD